MAELQQPEYIEIEFYEGNDTLRVTKKNVTFEALSEASKIGMIHTISWNTDPLFDAMVWSRQYSYSVIGVPESIHGEGVNLQDMICSRDDVLQELLQRKIGREEAYNIMDFVRLGNGVNSEMKTLMMRDAGLPAWYVRSCDHVTYLFPKSHIVEYGRKMICASLGYGISC